MTDRALYFLESRFEKDKGEIFEVSAAARNERKIFDAFFILRSHRKRCYPFPRKSRLLAVLLCLSIIKFVPHIVQCILNFSSCSVSILSSREACYKMWVVVSPLLSACSSFAKKIGNFLIGFISVAVLYDYLRPINFTILINRSHLTFVRRTIEH